MRTTISLLLFFVVLIPKIDGKSVPTNISLAIQPKIIGGQRLSIHERPYMLSLHRRQAGFQCGAFIISAQWGITAQHCFPLMETSAYVVRAGSDEFQKGGTLHRLTEIIVYDTTLYDEKVPISDIALFKVNPHFKFSSSVQPALLPTAGTFPNPKVLVVTGWGSLRPRSSTNKLRG
ncbi:prostasin-like [Belonocnema kinseyi]|uniref:prostasin-like n=1 Tax=Belonocnema kinseyi TaxID=2817044 RepID=UPI00143D9F1D|nr:prostasin-like [Belonocnema kinseyi]